MTKFSAIVNNYCEPLKVDFKLRNAGIVALLRGHFANESQQISNGADNQGAFTSISLAPKASRAMQRMVNLPALDSPWPEHHDSQLPRYLFCRGPKMNDAPLSEEPSTFIKKIK